MSLVTGKDEHGNDFQERGAYGDFRVTKHFVVTNVKNPRDRPNGWIVQYVDKKTTVTHHCGNKWDKTTKVDSSCQRLAPVQTLRTSADIEKFTSGNVKYMTHDYLELFEVKDGNGTYDDAFQNGAVVKYIWEKDESTGKSKWFPIIEDDIQAYFTKGEIVMTGLNIFIPATINMKKMFKWSKEKNTPANGLPYLEATTKNMSEIYKLRKSEPLVHKIHVSWGYPSKFGGTGNKSRVFTLSPRDGKSIMPKNAMIHKFEDLPPSLLPPIVRTKQRLPSPHKTLKSKRNNTSSTAKAAAGAGTASTPIVANRFTRSRSKLQTTTRNKTFKNMENVLLAKGIFPIKTNYSSGEN